VFFDSASSDWFDSAVMIGFLCVRAVAWRAIAQMVYAKDTTPPIDFYKCVVVLTVWTLTRCARRGGALTYEKARELCTANRLKVDEVASRPREMADGGPIRMAQNPPKWTFSFAVDVWEVSDIGARAHTKTRREKSWLHFETQKMQMQTPVYVMRKCNCDFVESFAFQILICWRGSRNHRHSSEKRIWPWSSNG
jgi:hypothetical protein